MITEGTLRRDVAIERDPKVVFVATSQIIPVSPPKNNSGCHDQKLDAANFHGRRQNQLAKKINTKIMDPRL